MVNWTLDAEQNHHSRKPPTNGWFCQFGIGSSCPGGLTTARRTTLTVSNSWLM
jgi:hypothetical protein